MSAPKAASGGGVPGPLDAPQTPAVPAEPRPPDAAQTPVVARTSGPADRHPLSGLFGAVSRWEADAATATAVDAPDGALSFAELAERTRSLAGALAAAEAGPGTAIALAAGRSRLSVPGLLAVWRLGATAILVDDRHPPDRLRYVLRDAEARIAVADPLPAGVDPRQVRQVRPDALGDGIAQPAEPQPEECAYVVYTSGTSGWPKGVEVTYRNLGAFLEALHELDLPPGGMGVNAVSPAFDGWLWCTLLCLLHGQGMAIVDLAADTGDAHDLAGCIAAHEPRTVCLTPSLWSACLAELPSASVRVVAGEPCPPALARRLGQGARVINVYGPTETTIAATWSDSGRGDDPQTIGRPLPGYRAYVLDDRCRPAPPGSAGKLYVGGLGVARGYLKRPELTAASFLPDPFAGDGARMYRTGDLVRLGQRGQLEFLGRRDDEQVKVRGFRVELGEIERVAAESPQVCATAAFVTASGDSLGLAVVTEPAADPLACAAQVREDCARRLPAFMVPSVVDVVDALPTLPTGKVDRAALARSCASPAHAGGRRPETEREQQICRIWGDLLSRAVEHVDANFFELGGHSLLAARAVAALRKATGMRLTIGHLLANPTAGELARELERLAEASTGPRR